MGFLAEVGESTEDHRVLKGVSRENAASYNRVATRYADRSEGDGWV